MTINLKSIILVLVLLSFITINARPQEEIRIHEKSNNTVYFSEIFNSASFIKLETNQDCLISNISSIKIDDNKIFILDKRYNKVLIFNMDGSFITQVGSIGKGPGEMVDATDITLDKKNKQLEILDRNSSKILVFDYDGNYKTTHKSAYTEVFEKMSDHSYLCYSYNYANVIDDKLVESELAAFDDQGKLLKEFEGIRNISKGINAIMSNLNLDNEGNAYIIPIMEYKLFRIDKKNNIENVGTLAFDTKIPGNLFKNANSINDAMGIMVSGNYPGMIADVTVVNGKLNFIFVYNRKEYFSFVDVDKKSSVTVSKDNFKNDFFLIEPNRFIGSFNNGLIALNTADVFKEKYSEYIKSDPDLSSIKSDEMKIKLMSLYKETDQGDNPILVFYSYINN